MDRNDMIAALVNDLERWQKADPNEFMDHVRDMERKYLKTLDTKQLTDLYEAVQ